MKIILLMILYSYVSSDTDNQPIEIIEDTQIQNFEEPKKTDDDLIEIPMIETKKENYTDEEIEKYKQIYSIFMNKLNSNNQGELRFLRENQIMDRPERLLGKDFVSNIHALPRKGEALVKPWSGHYWPHRYGKISVRYTKDEKDTQYYTEKRGRYIYSFLTYTYHQSIAKYLQPQEHLSLSTLPDYEKYVNDYYSASEKYDLLVGDEDFTLTNLMKQEGKKIAYSSGDTNTWSGICHGWSAASFMEYRPLKPVFVRSAMDKKTIIKFLPDDIKALASQYWADVKYENGMIGYRCNYFDLDKLPKDPITGLLLNYDCYGMSAASFHLAFTNHMGLEKKNLVFEPKVDAEIWNHPTYKYNSTYYNPLTKEGNGLLESIITIEEAKNSSDPFIFWVLKNADKDTKYLIGVNTTIHYISENPPERKIFNKTDTEKNVTYSYILELDKNKNVISGEWASNEHPNYIYTAKEEPATDQDKLILEFKGSPDYLTSIKEYIIKQSKQKLPLKAIVRFLIKRSIE